MDDPTYTIGCDLFEHEAERLRAYDLLIRAIVLGHYRTRGLGSLHTSPDG